MVALRAQRDVGDALGRLAGALESLDFGPDASTWSVERDRLAGTIRSYLIPRALDPSVPMTVVLAGPTGSGKSTLMNSLFGLDASTTGAIRPTTRSPVVLTRPGRADLYRVIGGVSCDVVTGDAAILDDLALVDAPDLDSTSTSHKAMAETLIDNADVVVFITSALRYADEVPWRVLRRAVTRGAPVINVLNRVGSPSAGAVVDFRSRLSTAGLDDELITVPEHHLAEGAQQVPALAVRSLRKRLFEIVSNRERFARDVFDRVLHSTVGQTSELARSMKEASDELDELAAELSNSLGDRVSNLELERGGAGSFPPTPPDQSAWSVRRWKKKARRVQAGTVDFEAKVVGRIVSIVHSDLRKWLVEEHSALAHRKVDPAQVIGDALARSTIEGWVEFVARIAADHDDRDTWLVEAVLVEAAMAGDGMAPVEMMFGEDGPVLVDRAYRELSARLEAIYRQVGDLIVGTIRGRYGDLDDEELRSRIYEVTSAHVPTYA